MNGADRGKYWELYSKYISNLRDKGKEWRGACPFNEEETPGAFSIDAETGLYFCHSCGEKGNAVSFARFVGDDERQFYSSGIFSKTNRIDIELVNRLHNAFIESYTQLPFNWDQELINALKIGFDERYNKLVFPIYNESGKIINLKWHKGKQTPGSKVSLYPLKFIDKYNTDFVVICEGEKDAITLLSNKLQAITGTGGALNVPKDLSSLEKFLHIYICFDNDQAGIAGAEKWAQAIKNLQAPKLVKIADIGRVIRDGGDITEYFNNPFTSRESFCREILDRSKSYKPFTDIPDFIRRVMLSEKYQNLTMRDQNVFTTLVLRASRYYVKTTPIKGKRISIGPGQYLTTLGKLQNCCARDITEKQVRGGIESLVTKGFIKSEDQKAQRGRLITIINWYDDGQQNGRKKNRFNFVRKYPFLGG